MSGNLRCFEHHVHGPGCYGESTTERKLRALAAARAPPDPRDAEIARLRAEVERLTRERDAAREGLEAQTRNFLAAPSPDPACKTCGGSQMVGTGQPSDEGGEAWDRCPDCLDPAPAPSPDPGERPCESSTCSCEMGHPDKSCTAPAPSPAAAPPDHSGPEEILP